MGTGKNLADNVVRLVMATKILSLSRGHSGIRIEVIDALITLFNAGVYPCIPEKGSVGASGDLAPLAHLSLMLIGEGQVTLGGETMSAAKATGSAWKFPPEITSPFSAKTRGLSDAAFASIRRMRAACRRLSRQAPIT